MQSKGLQKGARVALMMPNVLQYPAATTAVLRAGYAAVNVNPLYTPRELEHQLHHSQKLEALGTLAGGIAHDLNNALTAISGHAELALAALDAGAPARSDVEEIRRAASRAASITRQLLAFSRK